MTDDWIKPAERERLKRILLGHDDQYPLTELTFDEDNEFRKSNVLQNDDNDFYGVQLPDRLMALVLQELSSFQHQNSLGEDGRFQQTSFECNDKKNVLVIASTLLGGIREKLNHQSHRR